MNGRRRHGIKFESRWYRVDFDTHAWENPGSFFLFPLKLPKETRNGFGEYVNVDSCMSLVTELK